MNRLIVIAVVLVAVANDFYLHAETSPGLAHEDYFEVTLPEGFEISKQSPVEDFEMFRISRRNRLFVTIYVGNWPEFPILKPSSAVIATRFETADCAVISLWAADGLRGREILLKSNRTHGWPTRLHAITANLGPGDMRKADQILSSIVSKLDSSRSGGESRK